MKIVYPPAVEDAYAAMIQRGQRIEKAELYRKMVALDFIDPSGEPTQWAVDNGYVNTFVIVTAAQENPPRLEDFKRLYPVFAEFNDQHFAWTGKAWGVDMYVLNTLVTRRLLDPNSTKAEREQAKSLMAFIAAKVKGELP